MDSERYITQAEHTEFSKRIDEENKRQNRRIDALERGLQEISKITVNVERLATHMEAMSVEQKKQGERLTEIEQKPVKRWDGMVMAIITGAVGLIIGAVGSAIMAGLIH